MTTPPERHLPSIPPSLEDLPTLSFDSSASHPDNSVGGFPAVPEEPPTVIHEPDWTDGAVEGHIIGTEQPSEYGYTPAAYTHEPAFVEPTPTIYVPEPLVPPDVPLAENPPAYPVHELTMPSMEPRTRRRRRWPVALATGLAGAALGAGGAYYKLTETTPPGSVIVQEHAGTSTTGTTATSEVGTTLPGHITPESTVDTAPKTTQPEQNKPDGFEVAPEAAASIKRALPKTAPMNDAYVAAARETGVPKEIIMALDYAETSWDPKLSMIDGKPLGEPTENYLDAKGAKQVPGTTRDENIMIAAKRIKDHAKRYANIDVGPAMTIDQIANTLLVSHYYGRYQAGDMLYTESRYVMNMLRGYERMPFSQKGNVDPEHPDKGFGESDDFKKAPPSTHAGALTVYTILRDLPR